MSSSPRSLIRVEQVPPPLTADIPSSSSSSSQVLPPLRYPLEQILAAFVAKMDREICNMREAADEITGLLQRGYQTDQRVEKLIKNHARANTVHDNLVTAFHELQAQVNVQHLNLEAMGARIDDLEGQAEAANAAEVALEDELEEEHDEDAAIYDVNSIMSGRQGGRNGGRGNNIMTATELTPLINERVAGALAANPNGGSNNNHQVCTYKTFMVYKPHTFSGAEGAVGLLHWMEKTELVFSMCNCPQANQVKYASGTLEGPALTRWNSQVQMLTLEMANALPWEEFKTMLKEEYCPRDEVQKLEVDFWNLKMEGYEIETYTTRSHELATLCPQMVTLDTHFKSSQSNLPQHQQQQRRFEPAINLSQSGSTQQNQGSFADLQNKQTPTSDAPKGCFECGKEGYFKRDCPQLKKACNGNVNGNNQGGNGNNNGNGANGRAFVIGSGEARKDHNVVTGMFPLNDHFASLLFDTGADRSFISENFSKQIEMTTTSLEHKYSIEIADGKLIEATHILKGCKLGLSGHKLDIDLMPVTRDIVGIISYMKAQKCLRKGHTAILALVADKPSKEKKLTDIPIVRDFPEGFPQDLPGLPPHRQVEF
ncbi:hypothetical protein L1987_18909 [Smallanthus sonchifolius]|uniref:Uncharacterized protein n=1 Tax=Smallanthus sonchifolius TaxID=185202 RepID=A0ACB9J1G3_9ASTR|nr:hypothetical protein L1987_18909 [Smallanthus sonchifolius]